MARIAARFASRDLHRLALGAVLLVPLAAMGLLTSLSAHARVLRRHYGGAARDSFGWVTPSPMSSQPSLRRTSFAAANTVFHVHKNGTLLDAAEGPDGNLWVLHSAKAGRGCDSVSRYIHKDTPIPSLHLSATSNRAVGGSITAGVTGKSGQVSRVWQLLEKFTVATKTPSGDLWVPFDLFLSDATVGADDRAYHGLAIPNIAALRRLKVYAQGATAAGPIVKLTPPTELVLR